MLQSHVEQFGVLTFGVILAASLGCSRGGDKFADVRGLVLLDDQPLTSGMVSTVPLKGRGAQGEIDQQGRFILTSGDLGRGAQIGKHQVAVIAVDGDEEFSPEKPKRLLVPFRYTRAETSGLKIDVQAGTTNEVTLKLYSSAKTAN